MVGKVDTGYKKVSVNKYSFLGSVVKKLRNFSIEMRKLNSSFTLFLI